MTRLVCLCALVASITACGGVSIDDLKNKEIDALCDRLVRCGQVADKQVCVDEYDRLFNDATAKAEVANGSVSYDDGAAGDCIDALDGASCDPSSKDNRVTPDSCNDIVKGNRKQGDPCYQDEQCTSRVCTPPTGSCTMACCAGTCDANPPAPVAIGQSCEAALCVDGAFCDDTGTCAALLAEGQTCTSNDQCTYGTWCAGPSASALSCTKSPKAGDPCLMENGNFQTCEVEGLACDGTKCVTLLDKGATCSQTAPCKGDLHCDPTSLKCVVAPGDGQACTGLCAAPDHCALDPNTGMGTCTAPLPNGQDCTSSSDCDSNFCDLSLPTPVCADRTVCS